MQATRLFNGVFYQWHHENVIFGYDVFNGKRRIQEMAEVIFGAAARSNITSEYSDSDDLFSVITVFRLPTHHTTP